MVKNDLQKGEIKVWDLFIRFFHWTLVLSFVSAYLTSQSGMQNTHVYIGYLVGVLIAARLIWGKTGSSYARFSNFLYRPGVVFEYLDSIRKGHPVRYLGHNPAGGMMVLVLLLFLTFTTLSGLVVEAVIEFDGPLLGMFSGVSDEAAYAVRELHEWLVNGLLVLISLHILGVVLASRQHKENLVRAMITGRKLK